MLKLSRYPLAALLSALMVSGGCQFFAQRSSISTDYNLPLTVQLRTDPSIAAASLEYRDACGQAAVVPIHDALQKQLKKRLGQVFERVQVEGGDSMGTADGVLDVALGFRQANLFIPRKANKSYPATVTLGLDFSYADLQGTVLHSKKLQSSATGEVEARSDTCGISGLDSVAQEAIATLVEGMAQQLGTATKIREQAQFRTTNRAGDVPPLPAQSALSNKAALPVAPVPPAVQAGAASPPVASPATPPVGTPSGTTTLSFRTIIRDDNQNHVLEQQEAFSVEFEVKNEGAAVAQAVEIDLSGHAAIVGGLKTPVSLGVLQPGEVRRVAVDGKVGPVLNIEQAELICALRASANVTLPSSKKFFVAIRPDRSDAVEVLSVDVDQLPKANGKAAQPHAVGIAIGVGAFRDSAMPAIKFAAHDAEVMGGYFTRVLGIPSQQVKILIDHKGLKDDLIDVFEQWLPKQSASKQTAYIYVSGRAVVDQETGAVSLLPYDGSLTGASRGYSLARLQRALTRTSLKQAVLMLDLSLEPSPGSVPVRAMSPQWGQLDAEGDKDRLMVIVGNSAVQEAQAYQPGQHGLFTYFLLKGLRGAADLNKNGTVLTGELCAYVHGQVDMVTKTQSGTAQQTLCLPARGDQSALRRISVTKVR
ncbi:MAG: hypothetical protein H0V35_16160 [Nitrospira sp.]|nr:hypothetical protein [Nitrospira sp.]